MQFCGVGRLSKAELRNRCGACEGWKEVELRALEEFGKSLD
jgi:hypothetical protein